jgi:hypothetical protein
MHRPSGQDGRPRGRHPSGEPRVPGLDVRGGRRVALARGLARQLRPVLPCRPFGLRVGVSAVESREGRPTLGPRDRGRHRTPNIERVRGVRGWITPGLAALALSHSREEDRPSVSSGAFGDGTRHGSWRGTFEARPSRPPQSPGDRVRVQGFASRGLLVCAELEASCRQGLRRVIKPDSQVIRSTNFGTGRTIR